MGSHISGWIILTQKHQLEIGKVLYIVWVFPSTIIHQHSSSKEIKEKIQSHTNPNYFIQFEGNNILPCHILESCCDSVRSDMSSCLITLQAAFIFSMCIHIVPIYIVDTRGTNKDKYISIILWTIRTTAPNT